MLGETLLPSIKLFYGVFLWISFLQILIKVNFYRNRFDNFRSLESYHHGTLFCDAFEKFKPKSFRTTQTEYSIQDTEQNECSSLYSVFCIICSVLSVLYSVFRIMCSVLSVLYSVLCILYSIF